MGLVVFIYTFTIVGPIKSTIHVGKYYRSSHGSLWELISRASTSHTLADSMTWGGFWCIRQTSVPTDVQMIALQQLATALRWLRWLKDDMVKDFRMVTLPPPKTDMARWKITKFWIGDTSSLMVGIFHCHVSFFRGCTEKVPNCLFAALCWMVSLLWTLVSDLCLDVWHTWVVVPLPKVRPFDLIVGFKM